MKEGEEEKENDNKNEKSKERKKPKKRNKKNKIEHISRRCFDLFGTLSRVFLIHHRAGVWCPGKSEHSKYALQFCCFGNSSSSSSTSSSTAARRPISCFVAKCLCGGGFEKCLEKESHGVAVFFLASWPAHLFVGKAEGVLLSV